MGFWLITCLECDLLLGSNDPYTHTLKGYIYFDMCLQAEAATQQIMLQSIEV